MGGGGLRNFNEIKSRYENFPYSSHLRPLIIHILVHNNMCPIIIYACYQW